MTMKKNVILTLIIGIGLGCYIGEAYFKRCMADTTYSNKEIACIGGITIGMDSLQAVNLIKERMLSVSDGDLNAEIKTDGDSTGYTYSKFNEEYYITLDSGKVSRVFFHSDSLTDKEVKVIEKCNRYSRHKVIYHKGETWTAFQDGEGTYIIYKNE